MRTMLAYDLTGITLKDWCSEYMNFLGIFWVKDESSNSLKSRNEQVEMGVEIKELSTRHVSSPVRNSHDATLHLTAISLSPILASVGCAVSFHPCFKSAKTPLHMYIYSHSSSLAKSSTAARHFGLASLAQCSKLHYKP